MNSKLQSAAIRFLPSLTDVAFLMPLIFQFNQLGGAPQLLSDGDTGWHLRTGEWILAHGQVPQRDMFSFSRPGQPWFAWEWLWDCTFGYLNQHFGLPAVVLASMFLICLTSALLYRFVLRKCGNPLISIAVTFFATAGTSIHWLARPHLLTLLLTVVFLRLLDEAYVESMENRSTDSWKKKLLYVMPALMVLWTNLHGGFVAGLILIAAYTGGGAIRMLLERDGQARKLEFARVKPFFFCGVLCTLATLVNPYFIGLHQHVVKYLLDPFLYDHITEFMAFNFGHPSSRYIEVLMLLGATTACWNLYRRRFEYFVLLAGWLHMALQIRRNVPLFSLMCAPFVAEALVCWLKSMETAPIAEWAKRVVRQLEETAANIGATDALPRLHLVSAAAMALVGLLLYAPQPPKSFRASQDPENFPVKAASALLRDGDDRIFTTDTWGGYLIYRMYPKAKVFIDGRSDFYGTDFELKFLDVVGTKYDWAENLGKTGARTVLLPANYALVTAMKASSRWRVVYDDQVAVIFRRVDNGPSQQVSKRPSTGVGENCGSDAAGAKVVDRTPRESGHPRPEIVAEASSPKLPLLNRP